MTLRFLNNVGAIEFQVHSGTGYGVSVSEALLVLFASVTRIKECALI